MNEMPDIIKGFTHVEYLIVFNAILFGYIGAEYFSGWASMIRNRHKIKSFWQHTLWTVFAFTMFIQNWYGVWPRTYLINKSVFFFLFSLAPIFVFHIISVILFPDFNDEENQDMKSYHYRNIRWLYGLFTGYLCLTVLNSFVYADLGDVTAQNMIRGGGILLCVTAFFFHKVKVIHPVFLIIGYLALGLFLNALPA